MNTEKFYDGDCLTRIMLNKNHGPNAWTVCPAYVRMRIEFLGGYKTTAEILDSALDALWKR